MDRVKYIKSYDAKMFIQTRIIEDAYRKINPEYVTTLLFEPLKSQTYPEFPLSKKTLQGLEACKFETPTDIQREAIGLAIQGNDILGAAKTGSGKTLAFIIPVLECLFKQKWTQLDGLGALIISPTRELAFQTFEVLKKVGKFHDFSAGLVIGGKPLQEEAGRINRTNIVICTPGRLLQHLDETTNFTADTLKILVLDEADRILDLGFAQTMNAVIECLPTSRQTLLFSATQTRSVKDLARLSLSDPMFVSVHENAQESTPTQLEQNYMVCELHDKLSMLWSFLKNHLKSKILVFLTSCKQVTYIYEAFKRLRPGIPVMALHGNMPQLRRVAAYNQFVWKQNAVLFATDIAARGLDFPAVNWVVQLDCPEDGNTYIHRAGRTARYTQGGQSLLVLLPTEEEGMVKQLQDKKIPVEKIRVNQRKLQSIQPKLESNCAAEPELKEMAQRAFMSYLKSVFMMKNKKVFDVHAVDIEQFSRSLGLAIAPKVRFLKRDQKRLAEKPVIKAGSDISRIDSQVKQKSRLAPDSSDLSDDSESENSESQSSSEESNSDSEMRSKSTKNNNKLTKGTKVAAKTDPSVRSLKHDAKKNLEKKRTKVLTEKLKIQSKMADSGSESESSSGSEEDSDNSDSSDEEQEKGDNKSKQEVGFDVELNDEDDDLFKVKRNIDVEALMGIKSVDDDGGKVAKKPKKVSKFAEAKKALKKKITVNTKVTFDEEGEVELDQHKTSQVDVDTDRPDKTGGINIAKARQRMQQEDRIDKEIFRQKIKLRHREERLKEREENRKRSQRPEENEEEVVIGGDDDDDDADPLSFIPDPDTIYGKQNSDDDSDEMDFDEGPAPKKKKLPTKRRDSTSSDDSSGDDTSDNDQGVNIMDTELSLRDDEDLALKLLGMK